MVSVVCSVERPTRETQAEQYSDTAPAIVIVTFSVVLVLSMELQALEGTRGFACDNLSSR